MIRLFYLFWLFSYLFPSTKQRIRTPSASSSDHEILQVHLLIRIISHRVLFFIVKSKIVGKCWSESLRETALVSRQYNNYTHVLMYVIAEKKIVTICSYWWEVLELT